MTDCTKNLSEQGEGADQIRTGVSVLRGTYTRRTGTSLQRGYVYVALAEGRLKIGFTRNPEERLTYLARRLDGFDEIAVIEGCLGDEKRLHRRYAEHHINGDWFHPAPEIIADCAHNRLGRRGGLCKFRRAA